MNKLKLFMLFGLVAISILTLNAVSAYNHATFQLSDSITYNEDIIGEDRGFRSCIKVNQADMCMSGDIFPSQAICVNPNLRE